MPKFSKSVWQSNKTRKSSNGSLKRKWRKKIEIEGEGLLAQAIAHEIDHLEGILFIDKVIPGTLEYSTPDEQK